MEIKYTNLNEDENLQKNEDESLNQTQQEGIEVKNVDVFNALNLVCEDLGIQYEKEGYNPLGEDFTLTEDFANEILENKRNGKEISCEGFLEKGNVEVGKHFQSALKNNQEILSSVEEKMSNTNDPVVLKELKKTIFFLKNRNELLKIFISKLKDKDANSLRMYIELFGLDNELSELLKDSYEEQVNATNIANEIFEKCKNRAVKKSFNIKVNKIKQEEKLNEEIEEQQKQQAQEHVKQEQEKEQELKQEQEQEQEQESQDIQDSTIER